MRSIKTMQVKHQYSAVQALYWMTSCALSGYAAVYLQERGLSNTMIGIVVGGAACLSMAVQPLVAQLSGSIRSLTVKRMIQLLIIIMAVMFGILTAVPVPVALVIVLYMAMNTLNYCMPPMLSAMGMEFINRGYYLDFGFSRGLGSISYAVCAAVLGFVIDHFYPGILGYVYIFLAVLLLAAVSSMRDLEGEEKEEQEKSCRDASGTPVGAKANIWKVIGRNRTFLCLMAGFCLANMNNAAIATYTVNIVKNLGGNDSILGIANFISAASEMPVMLLFGFFMKKGNCIRLLKVSALFFVMKPLVLLQAGILPAALAGLAFQGLSFGMFTPAAVYYVNSTMAPEHRVQGQAVFSMITSGAATCGGNLLGGWLQDTFGLSFMLTVCTGMALVGFLFVAWLPEGGEKPPAMGYRIRRWLYHRYMKKITEPLLHR